MLRPSLPSVAIAGLFLLAVLAAPARAHRDDYIDETFVYMTLDRHEFEIELWGESRGGEGRAPTEWYTGAFEYGLTRRWTVDGAAQWTQHEDPAFLGRLRAESRYRFAEEGRGPLDLAASAEYEQERASPSSEYEQTLTPRVVVSRDLSPHFNTTVNLDFPITLTGGTDVAFAWALAARYPDEGFARYGVELKQNATERQAVVFPQVWFALPHEMTVKLGAGIGLTDETDPITGRLVFEAEF